MVEFDSINGYISPVDNDVSFESISLRDVFFEWLSAGNTKKYPAEVIISCIDRISEYAVLKKISTDSLWRYKKHDAFKPIYNRLLEQKLLRVRDMNTYKTFIVGGQLYEKFLRKRLWKQPGMVPDNTVMVNSTILKKSSNSSEVTEEALPLGQAGINPDDVIAWLVTQPNANGTLYIKSVMRSYMSSLRNAPQKLILKDVKSRNVFSCSTVAELDKLCTTFKLSPNFNEVNRTPWHGQFSAGLAVFRRYLEHLEIDGLGKVMPFHRSYLNQTIRAPSINLTGVCIFVYDWRKPTNVNGTKPYSIKIEDNPVIFDKSWKSLLVSIYEYAVMAFPEINITAVTYGNRKRILCSYKPNIVCYSKKLNNGLFVDTAWSANDVVGITKAIFNLCNVDVCVCEISYMNRGDDAKVIKTLIPSAETVTLTHIERNVLFTFKATFPMSMNLGYSDLKKLKSSYEKYFSSDILMEDDDVFALIRNNSILVADNRYTHIDNLVPSKVLKQIEQFIECELSKSDVHSRIYAKPLYDIFKSDLSIAVDEDLLLTIIETSFGNIYKANYKSMFVSKCKKNNSLSIGEEISLAIVKLLSNDIQPFNINRIVKELPGYPRNRIEQALYNGNPKIVLVDGTNFAHVDYIYIEDDDIKKIKSIISSGIAIDGYITVDALLNEIKVKVKDVLEGNEQISEQDIMKVVTQKVSSKYMYTISCQNGGRFLAKEGV